MVRASLEAANETLRAENAALRERVKQLEAQVSARDERLQVLAEHLGAVTRPGRELEQDGATAPKVRVQGCASEKVVHNCAKRGFGVNRILADCWIRRRCSRPSGMSRCPDCGYPLRGGSVWWERQVVDLPPPPPVVVTQHTFIRRWCPVCRCWCVPPLPTDLALGQGRLGLRVASLRRDAADYAVWLAYRADPGRFLRRRRCMGCT